MERAPQTKQDEQFPLLKVDSGGGDGGVQTAPTTVTAPWSVTHTTRHSWFSRWPEYISACWMTIILLGISFLVFYALGMEAYRRQPVLIVKCNSSKPADNVYYHHIVPRGSNVPFMVYSDYLSIMALKYPQLHIQVYFLLDDSFQTYYRGLIRGLIPTTPISQTKLDKTDQNDITELMSRHQNINVTILPLSKYMARTPLKYKWRNIPLPYLPFYARIYSVWQNGGIAMDLSTFNNYNRRHQVDRKIAAILKQHNNGINVKDYRSALDKIDREEETEFLSLFYGIIQQFLNETRSFIQKSFPVPQITTEKNGAQIESLTRTQRNKRDISELPVDAANNAENNSNIDIEIMNSSYSHFNNDKYQLLSSLNSTDNVTESDVLKTTEINNSTDEETGKMNIVNQPIVQPARLNSVVFYDFSVISDALMPVVPHETTSADSNVIPFLLSIDSEGTFIAASSRLHPFLSHLISAGCQRMPPKIAIRDTLITQCSGIYKEDTYCNNIYLL